MIMREKKKKRNERKKMKKKIQESASKLLSANTYRIFRAITRIGQN